MQDDFAIVIGLQHYPGLDEPGNPSLAGSEKDAIKFKEWLLNTDGGNLLDSNISLILSADFVKSNDSFDSKPTFHEIKKEFEKLRRLSLEKENKGLGPKIGRRFYIFMSGHGITPTPYGSITKEVGLLLSNVDQVNIVENTSHFPGCLVANWFCENECFDEVFLFMDCCRDIVKTIQTNVVFQSHGSYNKSKRIFAFSTNWGKRAKEISINGEMHGVFTQVLLQALNGAAADYDPDNPGWGDITAASLKSFLINNTKGLLQKSNLQPGESDEPEIEIVPINNNGRDILIKKVPIQKFSIHINLPLKYTGEIEVMTHHFKSLEQIKLDNVNEFELRLPRGVFCLQGIQGGKIVRSDAFNVLGMEDLMPTSLLQLDLK